MAFAGDFTPVLAKHSKSFSPVAKAYRLEKLAWLYRNCVPPHRFEALELCLSEKQTPQVIVFIGSRQNRGERLEQAGAESRRSTGSRQDRTGIDPFLGTSEAIRRLAMLTKRTAIADSPALIQGETGTEKSVLAPWIHEHSRRVKERFVDLNCGGLTRASSRRNCSDMRKVRSPAT